MNNFCRLGPVVVCDYFLCLLIRNDIFDDVIELYN